VLQGCHLLHNDKEISGQALNGITYEMIMAKDSPEYSVTKKRALFPFRGTELAIHPLLPGLRSLTGEKIQRYLASELRDQIRTAEATVKVLDRTGRKEFIVVPRQFSGRLLHNLKPAEIAQGDIYFEIYLGDPGISNRVGLYRHGTRVLQSITELDHFQKDPWKANAANHKTQTPKYKQIPNYNTQTKPLCRNLNPAQT
jgi:hypothetical protein